MNLTANMLLVRMQPGHNYSAIHLSRLCGAQTADIRGLLDQLVADGQLRTVKRSWQTFYFRADSGESLAELSRQEFAGETRAEESLSGYESTLAVRGQLSLLARCRDR